MKVKSESEIAQSCSTLSDPMACSPPGSSAHGIFQARVLELGAILTTFIQKFFQQLLFEHLSSVQLLSCVQLFVTSWTAARQPSLSITNSWSPRKPMSIESVMPSNHLILCCPLFFPPSIFPSIRISCRESVLHIRWPKFGVPASASALPINIPLGWTGWISSQSKGLSRVLSNTTVQKHQFFGAQLSL